MSHKLRETRYIEEDHLGFVWMMRVDGFYRFDGKVMDFIDISYDRKQPFFHSSANILALENGDYWFAARDAGLAVYQADKDRFIYKDSFDIEGQPVQAYIRCIIPHPHHEHKKIVAGTQGVWILDQNMDVEKYLKPSTLYNHQKYINYKYNRDQIRILVYDPIRDYVWMGGMAGLFAYDLKNDHFLRFPVKSIIGKYDKDRDSYLINDIKLDSDQLICATWFGGIMTFDIASKEWTSFVFNNYTDQERSPGNTQIAENRDGLLFTAHETYSLASWRRDDPFLGSPTMEEGEPVGYGIGAWVDRLGYLWIGHWGEICRYQIEQSPPIAKVSNIYVRQILLNDQLVKQRMNLWDHQTFTYDQKETKIQFQFRAINPLSYDDINYEYRLEDLQTEWVKNGPSEIAEFKNLEPGTYYFQARYLDPISNEYQYTGKVQVIFEPSNLVSRNLLYGTIGLLGISLIGFLSYRQFSKRRRLRAIQQYETRLREVQDAALRSQMNPHFLFNSLNSIRYFIVTSDNDKAAKYLTKFSRLIRMILENSKKKKVSLTEEIQILELYINMEQIRFEGKFSYKVNLSQGIDPNYIQIPPMLIQPYIENAILHGINPKEGPGKIILDICYRNDFLLIRIIDDGIGIARSKALKQQSLLKKESLGMGISKARLELNEGKQKAKVDIIDLKDTNGASRGTEVQLWLPKE